ncbi:serine/threonine-protein kinase [Krasilnikovia sp. MM14-A1259]|uniref:serine/threonine-protein kinase n=1 Tax=Krasilnikovia sp. MM14-A1259 TaxID=3373539 RepID=UPI003811018C
MPQPEALLDGRYRIVRDLHARGTGRLWLARDEMLDRDVAIREMALPPGHPEQVRLQALREARAAARFSHPNVIQIYDVQPGDERPWIVQEYVRSRPLRQVVAENGALPVGQVAGIGLTVLSALDAADRAGVPHRDISPGAVLLTDDGRVVLTGFGPAPAGAGPHECAGCAMSSPEADLWSLGATLYTAAEGRQPSHRCTVRRGPLAGRPGPMRRAGPLRPVLTGLLRPDPHTRMTPDEVEKRLRRLADVQTTVHLRHVPNPRRRAPTPVASGRVRAATTGRSRWRSGWSGPSCPPGRLRLALALGAAVLAPLVAVIESAVRSTT